MRSYLRTPKDIWTSPHPNRPQSWTRTFFCSCDLLVHRLCMSRNYQINCKLVFGFLANEMRDISTEKKYHFRHCGVLLELLCTSIMQEMAYWANSNYKEARGQWYSIGTDLLFSDPDTVKRPWCRLGTQSFKLSPCNSSYYNRAQIYVNIKTIICNNKTYHLL